ncbi:ATP-binding cassette domain-containing protein [Geothrix sp. PMB-07]|uniref:ATP-binding cassette domain-containing protein n=1 Tax=Geothrix sp. PMB-07 TaxID=3068640 RepID=UPI0027413964|nr:ATP-binding cassette domain-containing protein [Geothrix sp. PMB-07]WLT32711.1 ATP-binding cassette domain-containing protein [Geothrix sp. PMB-07]
MLETRPVAAGSEDIVIRGAAEHNLKGFDLRIPRRSLTVITGVSGSGKSSLAFDTLFREGQRRFLETLPAFSRQFVGGLSRPALRSIEGLGPAVALGQRVNHANLRSTVGTLTEGWDLLRLLFARLGKAPEGIHPTRGLFSFNGEAGACPQCQGLGVEDRLDLDLLVADPAKSLREGALRVSTPNGYLMYSQVTLAVLDEVLRAHGGSVDTPWRDLSDEVRQVVLQGSERLKVPYGKHPLESRLKWAGITARPRPEGFYRGLVPVMEEILRSKRNDSILRFVRSSPCGACGGTRLRPEALAVSWQGWRIVDLAAMPVKALGPCLAAIQAPADEAAILDPIRQELLERCELMEDLGLGYLSLDRPAPSLSRGEAQRLRLLGLALGELRGLLLVLDEPSAGLHPSEVARLIQVLQRLRDQGQTVVVVEHEAQIARAADWLVDLGPGPGKAGGELLWSGPPAQLLEAPEGRAAATRRWLQGDDPEPIRPARIDKGGLKLDGLNRNNLQNLAIELALGALNVVSGVSGAGKSSLLEEVVQRLGAGGAIQDSFQRIVRVDAEPIGRTPRSNAATYTGASDLLRDLFAATPEAKARGFGRGHFSFNTAGGRCEACEGAGVQEVGLRHFGTVELPCEACGGRRFHPEVLTVQVRGRSMADLLEGSIAETAELFADQPKLRRILKALLEVGLGYLPLGQPATTLSGGEAQRVKLAAELAKAGRGAALIVLDEPSTGLHSADVHVLLESWDRLLDAGHTLLVADNHRAVLRHADQVLDLGPGSGPEGGRLVCGGRPEALMACEASLTGAALRARPSQPMPTPMASEATAIELRGVRTHNLQGIEVAIPARGLTVVTGPSGSGKSSLVFDTLLAEAQNRFADLVSPWARRLLPRRGGADLESAHGLQAAIAVPQRAGRRNPRSTVGSVTELDELLRLIFSRAGERPCPVCGATTLGERCACGESLPVLWASDFSPHSERGACPRCKGLGLLQRCDPERLVSHPDLPLDGGALGGTRFGAYLGEPDGQFMATLRHAAGQAGLSVEGPWRGLAPEAQQLALYGTGDRIHEVSWWYRRGKSEGVHHLKTAWAGLLDLVDREYERTHAEAKGAELEVLLADVPCEACDGERLKEQARRVRFGPHRLGPWLERPLQEMLDWFATAEEQGLSARAIKLTEDLREDVVRKLRALAEAGLGYLSLRREMASLSGGEAQRVRLAASLSGGLVGVTYVLDEPSQGLHSRDVRRLGGVLRGLAEAGNAVVLVEHDRSLIAAADHVIELGPGAGPAGGRLVAAGPPRPMKEGASRARKEGRQDGKLDTASGGVAVLPPLPAVGLRGASLHNLQSLDVAFPVGALVAVSGVSGSGKSSLVMGVLAPSLQHHLEGRDPVGCEGLETPLTFESVLCAQQGSLELSPQSTVSSLAGFSEALRKRFAATPRAKALKLGAKHFSTARPGGRCEACEGRGVITIAMDLLPDVALGCDVCGGQRFQPQVLECLVEGKTITDVLEASVAEAALFFTGLAPLAKPMQALCDMGLGYLKLGQEGSTLSEGERQRLRLATLLAEMGPGRRAILLDEPTRGLGFEDVTRLVDSLRQVAGQGHLVVAVEHDLVFLRASDWVIDLGPEAGAAGGRVVAQGPPEALTTHPESHTGQALAAPGNS